MEKIKSVTKHSPCPHCGKTDWCYELGELSVCCRDYPPAKGWRETKKQDKNGHPIYAPDTAMPMDTSKAHIIDIQNWEYLDRNGDKLVAVERKNLSDGKKQIKQKAWTGKTWTYSTKHVPRTEIPVYKYREVRKAIALGKTIFYVEGEKCADALWDIGLVATTNYRGSGGFSESDMKDLEGADLVICPDRDIMGMKLANQVAEHFPNSKWLYAYPESKLWNSIPNDGGLDVADWIGQHYLKADDILKAVENRREITLEEQKLELIGFTKEDKKKLAQMQASIDRLIENGLPQAEKEIFLTHLSSLFSMQADKLKSYYYSRLKQLEIEETKPDIQAEIDKTLDTLTEDLPLDAFLPDEIAKPLKAFADQLKYKEISILTATSVLHKVGTRIKISEDFLISPNIFSFLVAPSGQGKSPLLKMCIGYPFSKLEKPFIDSHRILRNEWESAIEEWKSIKGEAKPPKPEEPPISPRILFATDVNGTAVNQQFSRYPDYGFLGIYDEGKKLLNFNGRGRTADDESDLLSFYDGTGVKELRTEKGVRTNVASTNYGIYAGIQPNDLLELMGQCEDSRGKWARFLFTIQHKERRWYDFNYDDRKKEEVWELLARYYQRFLANEKKIYILQRSGQKKIQDYLNHAIEPMRMQISDSVIETFLNKAGSRIGKLLINLHLWSSDDALSTNLIDDEVVHKALCLDEFYTKQIELLYSKSRASRGELDPLLAEIMSIARRIDTPLRAKDVQNNSWIFRKAKYSPDTIRQYFKQLSEFGYGTCDPDFGTKMRFIANK
jgi:hypothetical protein